MRRTNADKRKAVMTLLEDGEWSQWSDREIARHTHVDHTTVGRIRTSLVESTSDESPPPRTYTTKHGTTATMDAGKIKRPEKAKRYAHTLTSWTFCNFVVDRVQHIARRIYQMTFHAKAQPAHLRVLVGSVPFHEDLILAGLKYLSEFGPGLRSYRGLC